MNDTAIKTEDVINSDTENPTEIKRTAFANWQGGFKEGEGTLSTESGVLEGTSYSYKTRFEEGEIGTNPEELLAAAHAGCFTMSVAAILNKKKLVPTSLSTTATTTMVGLAITGIHISINGLIPEMTDAEFSAVVVDATKNCLISKILNIRVTSEAHLTV